MHLPVAVMRADYITTKYTQSLPLYWSLYILLLITYYDTDDELYWYGDIIIMYGNKYDDVCNEMMK